MPTLQENMELQRKKPILRLLQRVQNQRHDTKSKGDSMSTAKAKRDWRLRRCQWCCQKRARYFEKGHELIGNALCHQCWKRSVEQLLDMTRIQD